MSTLLRRSGQLARISRPRLNAAPRAPSTLRRRAPGPQCIYTQQCARRFATGPPEEPNSRKKDDEVAHKDGQAQKPEPEGAKQSEEPPPPPPQMAKLTPEEEKMLDQLVSFVSIGVPK